MLFFRTGRLPQCMLFFCMHNVKFCQFDKADVSTNVQDTTLISLFPAPAHWVWLVCSVGLKILIRHMICLCWESDLGQALHIMMQ